MTTGIYEVTDTWNAAGTVFKSIKMTVTDTAYAAGSKIIDLTTTVAGGYFNVDVNGNIASSGYMDFNAITAPTYAKGRLWYDDDEDALSYYNENADITVNIAQETIVKVTNNSGGDIDDGTVVYIDDATAGVPQIEKSLATISDAETVGITTTDVADTGTGYVTAFGIVRGIDTSSFSVGDILYLSASVAGELVNVQPAYPNKIVEIAHVLTSAVDGKIFVHVAHQETPREVIKSYTFASRNAASGEYFQGGFYDYSAADANLTNASPTVTIGTANHPYASHAFIVSGGNGNTDGSDLVLTVSGTSITDAGVRTPADSQVIVADCGTSPADTYYETPKKWIGTVTFTLTSTGGATFGYDFNYGTCKYDDLNNQDFTIRGVESVGLCNANDTGINIELLHHNDAGWIYHATAFQAGNTPVADMNTDHGTEQDIANGESFAWKRSGIDLDVAGGDSEGFIIRVTTGTANSISYMDSHIIATRP